MNEELKAGRHESPLEALVGRLLTPTSLLNMDTLRERQDAGIALREALGEIERLRGALSAVKDWDIEAPKGTSA